MVYQKILCNFCIQVVLIEFKGTFLKILDESPLSSIRMSFKFYQNVPVYKNYKEFSDKPSYNRPIIIYSAWVNPRNFTIRGVGLRPPILPLTWTSLSSHKNIVMKPSWVDHHVNDFKTHYHSTGNWSDFFCYSKNWNG